MGETETQKPEEKETRKLRFSGVDKVNTLSTNEKGNTKNVKIAVIRIRGTVKIPKEIRDTLDMLHLHRRNFCAVVENKPEIVGMIKKVKDRVTWGEVNEETLKLLREKRERKGGRNEKKVKKFYRLNPPRKGFERKGIKVSFKAGGALGYRGEKINELIKRMV